VPTPAHPPGTIALDRSAILFGKFSRMLLIGQFRNRRARRCSSIASDIDLLRVLRIVTASWHGMILVISQLRIEPPMYRFDQARIVR